MGIVKCIYLSDIKKYEYETGNSVFDLFNKLRLDILIDIISIGNGNCGVEQASIIFDEYIKNNDISIILKELKEMLLGEESTKEHEVGDESVIDITKMNNLTELYSTYAMQLMSVGLSYTEFWAMNTNEMFNVFNSILIKLENEENKQLSLYHTLALMVGASVWGKAPKEAPHVNLTNKNDGGVDGVDTDTAVLVAQFNRLANVVNSKENKDGNS